MATQKELFNRIMTAMSEDAEVVALCESKLAQLSKTSTRKNTAADEFAAAVATFLDEEEDLLTCGEIAEKMGESPQKISAALKRLGDAVITVEPSKVSGKKLFCIAA